VKKPGINDRQQRSHSRTETEKKWHMKTKGGFRGEGWDLQAESEVFISELSIF